ncbi:MAG: hypothetical protein GY854_12560 [Deltaproteobacteria bacterium]|nr:hypothetical protein [Deltaproteobacteria bacterium]
MWSNIFTDCCLTDNSTLPAQLYLEVLPKKNWFINDTTDEIHFKHSSSDTLRRISIERHDLSGTLNQQAEGYHGSFTVNADGPEALTVLIRTCLSFLCEDSSEILLHASAVKRNGHYWVFCGPSGSGKSTIAVDLRGDGRTMSIDRVVLWLGKDNRVRGRSTPFSDTMGLADAKQICVVAGIFHIEQGKETEIGTMTPYEATRSLLPQVLAFSRSPDRVRQLMETVGSISESGLNYRLRFTKDELFWKKIDRLNAGDGSGK